MKRIFFTGLFALLASVVSIAKPMNDQHVLTSLWKEYEEASKADRPQKEAEIQIGRAHV